MAYKSQIDLGGIGEVPKTTDSDSFADLTDVYNAIHILAQWTNALVERSQEEGDKGSDKQPWELLRFEKWLWLPTTQYIAAGDVVSSIDIKARDNQEFKGVYKGAHVYYDSIWGGAGDAGPSEIFPSVLGVALEAATPGELVKFGVGPAVINISGVKAGDILASQPALHASGRYPFPSDLPNDGQMYLNPPFPRASPPTLFQVAIGVGDNAALFFGPSKDTGRVI